MTTAEENALRLEELGRLANVRQTEGRYAEAESLYRRALAMAKGAFAPGDLDIAACGRSDPIEEP